MKRKIPELLSPAGNFEKLRAAILYGCDAVYLAGQSFGMRAAAGNFAPDELEAAISYAHSRNVRVYVTVNTLPREYELDELTEYLRFLAALSDKPDAVICADFGVAALIRGLLPEVKLHVSTQAGVVNRLDALAWYGLGASRIVLARELTIDEIKRIREGIPSDMELEAFVHGSMCVSYSGRCLLSNHFTARDANRGMCAQPCRWNYRLFEIEEEKRVGERLTVEETDRGTFVMSSRDMCMIEHISALCECGLSSLKIEGRMKSAYYAAVTANAYRIALDSYANGDDGFDPELMRELEGVSHRPYCSGFFFDDPRQNAQICEAEGVRVGYIREKSYIAAVSRYDRETGMAFCVQKNKLTLGDRAELITPGRCGRPFTVTELYNSDGEPIESTPHPSMPFSLKLPFEAKEGDIIRK